MRTRKVSSLLIGTCVMMISCVHGIPQFNTDLGIGEINYLLYEKFFVASQLLLHIS